jgi:hypothetical protein
MKRQTPTKGGRLSRSSRRSEYQWVVARCTEFSPGMTVQLAGPALAAAIRARSFGGVAADSDAKRAMPSSSPTASEIGSAGPDAHVEVIGGGGAASTGGWGAKLSPRISVYAVLRIMARSPEGLRVRLWGHVAARRRQVDPMGLPIQPTCDSGAGFFGFSPAVRPRGALTPWNTAEILSGWDGVRIWGRSVRSHRRAMQGTQK